MYKKTITYTDYDDNKRTEDFYFNLNKAEIMEMEMGTSGGMQRMLEKIIAEQDTKRIIDMFKEIIVKAYGEKDSTGKRFLKIDDNGRPLYHNFIQTEAYSDLFMELATDADAATRFVNGIVPQDIGPQDHLTAKNNVTSVKG